MGELLLDTPGALWKPAWIEDHRISPDRMPRMRRKVIAIDPAMSTSKEACETGIVLAGLGEQDSRGYSLVDASGKYTADGWARQALSLFDTYQCDAIVAESNLPCGPLVMEAFSQIRPNAPVKLIKASTSKKVRAQPIAMLAEQGRISHVGHFPQLETQLLEWDAQASSESPDRLDAYAYAFHELMIVPAEPPETRITPALLAKAYHHDIPNLTGDELMEWINTGIHPDTQRAQRGNNHAGTDRTSNVGSQDVPAPVNRGL